jgi:Flp pilus assembly protein TadG
MARNHGHASGRRHCISYEDRSTPDSRRQRAQAVLELALVLPLLLLLAFGSIGVGRVVQAQMAVSAAAREAARQAALAPLPPGGSASEAKREGEARGQSVASGYGLPAAAVSVDATGFSAGSWVRADVTYAVSESDLPLLKWTSFTLHDSHLERVDPYRSQTP